MSTYSNKLILYLKAFLILILLFFIVSILTLYQKNQSKLAVRPNNDSRFSENENLKTQSIVLDPKIVGLDIHDNPFSIVAKQASYEKDKVLMDQIEVILYLYDKKPTVINADYGVAEIDIKKVTLHNNVKVLFADGDTIFADTIVIDYNMSVITSNSPVLIQSKGNQIRANGFKAINEKGKRKIIFYGKVKANLQVTS